MTAPIEDPTGTAGSKTFTQAEVDAIVRDRLKRERDATATKYADYEQLKTAASEADKTKTQLDKVLDKLTAAEERTGKLEAQNLRNDVLTSKLKGVPASLTKHLQGKTKEELESAAEEMLADWKEAGGKIDDDDTTAPAGPTTPPATAPRGRPTEALHSGAPMTPAAPEETNPTKLAALIPRR
jgi:hypothetical protein